MKHLYLNYVHFSPPHSCRHNLSIHPFCDGRGWESWEQKASINRPTRTVMEEEKQPLESRLFCERGRRQQHEREWQKRSLQRLKDIFLWDTLQRPTSLSIFRAKKLFSKEMPAGQRWNTIYDNTQPPFQWWINFSRTSCAPRGNWCLARSSELWLFGNLSNRT